MPNSAIDRLLVSRHDVPGIVDLGIDAYSELIPGNPSSEEICRQSAIQEIARALGNNTPPNGYARYTFIVLAAMAAKQLCDELFEIRWSEPADWRM